MTISRRNFLALLAAVPAAAKSFLQKQPALAVGPPDELVTVQGVRDGLPLDLSPGCRRFASTERIIRGPCRVYDFVIHGSGTTGDRTRIITVTRGSLPQQALMNFGMHERGGFRWVACPNSELVIPDGDTFVLGGFEDLTSTVIFERPDASGEYPLYHTPEGFAYPDDDDGYDDWDEEAEWPESVPLYEGEDT